MGWNNILQLQIYKEQTMAQTVTLIYANTVYSVH